MAADGRGLQDVVPYQPISPRFWVARQTVIAAIGVPTVLIGFFGGLAVGGAGGVAIFLACVAFVGMMWSIERGRYRSWGYAEREDDLVVRRGLLFRRISAVPYGRMQYIDVSAGPVDRAFGLATVQLHTAAAASNARIPGLMLADAQQLRDRLAAVGEARATGL